jgi:alkyl hydroperoxide reductase subunit AhpC
MLSLNQAAPPFELDGLLKGKVDRYSLAKLRGQWVVLFFYPADFTFVCPTEIRAFNHRLHEFAACGCRIVALSVDDVDSHRAWVEELGGIGFPLLSDPTRATCRAYGVLNEAEQRAWRATFIISPEGTIAYLVVSPMNVGRSVDETLRVLQALQTGRLCPADWKPGDPLIESESKY